MAEEDRQDIAGGMFTPGAFARNNPFAPADAPDVTKPIDLGSVLDAPDLVPGSGEDIDIGPLLDRDNRISYRTSLLDKTSTDDIVRSYDIGGQTGANPKIVRLDPDKFENERRSDEYERLLQTAPRTADFMARDPDNAKLMAGSEKTYEKFEVDYGEVSRKYGVRGTTPKRPTAVEVEQQVLEWEKKYPWVDRRLWDPISRGWYNAGVAMHATEAMIRARHVTDLQQFRRNLDRYLEIRRTGGGEDGEEALLVRDMQGVLRSDDYFGQNGIVSLAQIIRDPSLIDRAEMRGRDRFTRSVADIVSGLKKQRAIPVNPRLEQLMRSAGPLEAITTVTDNPSVAIELALTSFVQYAPAVIVGIASGGTLMVPAAGASSFALEFGNAAIEVLQKRGIDVTNKNAVAEALKNPETRKAIIERGATRGFTVGTLDATSAGLAGFRFFGRPIFSSTATVSENVGRAARFGAREMFAQTIVDAGLGGLGEALGQMFTEGKISNWGEVIAEIFAEIPGRGFEMIGASPRIRADAKRIVQAKQTERMIKAMGDTAEASELRKKLPEKHREAVEAIVGGEGGVTTAYLDPDQFQTFLQSGITPAERRAFLQNLGLTEADISVAEASGKAIEIGLDRYATYVAGTEAFAALSPHTAFSPDALTPAQAQAARDGLPGLLQEELARAQEILAAEDRQQETADIVYERVKQDLIAAGTTDNVASRQAVVHRAFAHVLESRFGVDPVEFYARRMGLRIERGETTEAPRGRVLSQEDVRREADLLARDENFRAWFGDSKVVDESGAPLVVYHGTDVDVDAFDPGNIGAREVGWLGEGFYFSPSAEEATGYATSDGYKAVEGGNVVPVYLAIKNPLVVTRAEDPRIETARDSGYDGVVWHENGLEQPPTEIVAFDPTQIKSIFNRGTFDPSDPRILYQGPARRAYGIPAEATPLSAFDTDAALKAHPDYKAAKAGDRAAAARLVSDLTPPEMISAAVALGPDVVYVPVVAEEATGRNQIPWALAAMLAESAAAQVEDEVVQSSRAFHTGAKPTERLLSRPTFSGPVAAGRRYVIVDDVTVLGGTLAELANHIQAGAGAVVGVATLVNASRSRIYSAPAQHVRLIEERFGDTIREELGVEPEALTADEAQYLVNFRDADALGDRLAKAKLERERRLLQKGVRPPAPEDGGVTYEQSPGAEKPRGNITLAPGETTIRLFEARDLSTFLHESGHFFLASMEALAFDGNEQAVAMVSTVKQALGMDPAQVFETEQHEAFARSFEAYLMTGEAPSLNLREVFRRFKSWLVQVYRSIRNLDVDLNDDLRGVFDRLLATDDEIAAAKQALVAEPLFDSAEAAGLTQEQYDSYLRAAEEATELSGEELLAKTMRTIRRERRAADKAFKALKRDIRTVARARVESMPVYQALYYLRNNTFPNGDPTGLEPIKLSAGIIDAEYGAERRKALPGRGRNALVSREGGLHPDEVAPIFGFSSGDEMLTALAEAPPMQRAIRDETQREMAAREPDPYTDDTIAEEAEAALHNDPRATFLAIELRALSRRAGLAPPPPTAAREAAKAALSERRTRDATKWHVYLEAERKAGRAALEALRDGDIAEATRQKRRQVIAYHLTQESRKVSEEVEKRLDRMRQWNRKKTRERVDPDFVPQIDDLLERFDLATVSDRKLSQRRDLRSFAEQQEAAGKMVVIDERLLDEAYTENWADMSLEEFRGLSDAYDNLYHLGRMERQIWLQNRRVAYEDAVEEIVSSIEANNKWRDPPPDYAPEMFKKPKRGVRQFMSDLIRPEFLFERLDGYKIGGPVWNNLFRPIAEAEGREADLMSQSAKKFRHALRRYSKAEKRLLYRSKVWVPEIGASMSRATLLSVALNMGNEYNREALMLGEKWSEDQLSAVLSHVTERDWQTAQDIWDMLEGYRPLVAEVTREMGGIQPAWVDPTPVETPYGTFRGGYYPIRFDTDRSYRALQRDEKADIEQMFGGNWARAQTRQGHTKERTSTGGQPLRLDITVVAEHVTNVIHDATFRPAVVAVDKLLGSSRVREAIEATAGQEAYRMLRPWLKQVASDRRPIVNNWLEKAARHLRYGVSIVAMGFNLSTALVQVLGYSSSAALLGPKYSIRGLGEFLGPLMKRRIDHISAVFEQSAYMRSRQRTFDRDVRDALKDVGIKDVGAGGVTGPVREFAFYLIGLMDVGVSSATWMGAYAKAVEAEGMDHADAVQYADSMVRRSQGGGSPKDLAGIQHKWGEFGRLFTMFYSFFGALYNQIDRGVRMTIDHRMNLPQAAAYFFFLLIVPAVLEALMKGEGPDEKDDESWAKFLAGKIAAYPTASVPIVRDVIGSWLSGFDYRASPVVSVGEKAVRAGRSIAKLMDEEKDFTRADARAWSDVIGMLGNIPTGQFFKMIDYIVGADEGLYDFNVYEFLVTGRPKEARR